MEGDAGAGQLNPADANKSSSTEVKAADSAESDAGELGEDACPEQALVERRPSRLRRGWLVGIAATLLALAGGLGAAGYFALRSHQESQSIAREAVDDDIIDGHRIRRGTTVVIPIHHIHHDPRWWPDPDRFDPGRFLRCPTDRPRCAYLPFGGGRRICIGQSFALMEMVLMAAIMSQHFTFDLAPGYHVELEATLTLRPKHGVHVIGRRR